MPAVLRVQLFGTPRLFYKDQPLLISAPPKTIPLLAYLVLRPGERLPREKIAFTLWPDESENAARSNLRRHLYHLQRVLPQLPAPDQWIDVTASKLRWNPKAEILVDVLQFLRASLNETNLNGARVLYVGDFLEGYYDDWVVAERERLREIHLQNLLRMIVIERGRRAFAATLEMAAEILRLDPWRENALRALMEVRHEIGDRAGALSAYEQFAHRLAEELDVKPMSETTALYEAIRRDIRVDTNQAEISPHNVRSERTSFHLPFVGRDGALQRLSNHWKRATSGRGQTVLVTGEAGVGKTRVAREFALRSQADGARILWGTTPAFEPQPYHAVLAALRNGLPMLGEDSLEPRWASALGAVLPEIHSYISNLEPAEPLAGRSESGRFFEAVTRAFEALAKPRPLMLVLEDLHHAGSETLALIEYVVRRLQVTQTLCIVTCSDEEIKRESLIRAFRRRLAADGVGEPLALSALRESDIAELCDTLRVGNKDAMAQRFFAQSEGNAYFLSEVVCDWQEGAHTDNEAAPAKAILTERLGRLSEATRIMAEIAATLGRGFNLELLREVCEWPEAELTEALDELLDRRLIREPASSGHGDYTFSHQLTRDAIYESLHSSSKRRRHRRAARALVQLYQHRLNDYAAEIARHFEFAHEPEQAAKYYLHAAMRARDIFANGEALELAERAEKLAVKDAVRFAVCALREELLRRLGRREEQYAELKRLCHLAEVMGDMLGVCEAFHRQCLFHRESDDLERYTEACTQLEKSAKVTQTPRYPALAAHEKGLLALRQGDLEAADAAANRAEVLCAQVQDSNGVARAVALQTDVAISSGNLDAAEDLLIKARELSRHADGAEALFSILTIEQRLAFFRRDFEASHHFGTELLVLAEKVGDREAEANAHVKLGASSARFFRYEEATRHYEQASQIYQSIGNARGQAIALFNRGVLEFNVGRIADAFASSEAARSLFARVHDARGLILADINLGVASLFAAKVPEAIEHASHALQLAQGKQFGDLTAFALVSLGAAYREGGDLKQAVGYLEAGVALRKKQGLTADLLADLADLALAYLMAGRLSDARRVAAEFKNFGEATSERLNNLHIVTWQIARVFHALGDLETAGTMLARVRSLVQVWRDRAGAEADRSFTAVCARTGLLDALERGVWPSASAPLFTAG